LDFWLSHVQSQKSVILRHYTSPAFLSVSSSDVTVHRLFLDLITALQPLAQLPFHLEYDFELNRLERSQQRQAAADADPAAGVRRSLARQSFSTEEAHVDVGRRLRSVLGRLGTSATQSLVLAKNALQATSSLPSAAASRPPRSVAQISPYISFCRNCRHRHHRHRHFVCPHDVTSGNSNSTINEQVQPGIITCNNSGHCKVLKV